MTQALEHFIAGQNDFAQVPPTLVGLAVANEDLSSLWDFLAALPQRLGVSFIVASRRHNLPINALTSQFSRYGYPLEIIEEATVPQAGCCYIAPLAHHLALIDGRLCLEPLPRVAAASDPVEALLLNLAVNDGLQRATAVILTALAPHHLDALQLFKAAGGRLFNHPQASAETAATPYLFDALLPPAELACALEEAIALPASPATPTPGDLAQRQLSRRIRELQRALHQSLEDKKAITHDLACSNAALQESNAELHYALQAMRRANAELETTSAERGLLKEQLLTSNQRLQMANADLINLIDSMASPVLVIDSQQRILRANQAAAGLFRFNRREQHRRLLQLPLPTAVIQQLIDAITSALRQRCPICCDLALDGNDYRLEVHPYTRETHPHKLQSSISESGCVLTLINVSTHKQMERLLAAAVNSTDAAIARIDHTERLTYSNQAFSRLVGRSIGAIIGTPLSTILSPSLYRQLIHHLKKASGGEGLMLTEVAFIRADGQQVIHQLTLAPEVEPPTTAEPTPTAETLPAATRRDGAPPRAPGSGAYYLTCVDITETKQMAMRQREMARLESLGRLTAGIAHDFNNLLAVIQGNVELAQIAFAEGDPTAPQLLEDAVKAVNDGESLIQALLAYAHQRPERPQVLNIDAVFDHLLTLCRPQLPAEVVVEVEARPAQLQVETDPSLLHTALMNLIINATKAMPNGGQLTLRAEAVDFAHTLLDCEGVIEAGSYVLLSISDSGIGMSPTVLARCREPFFTTRSKGEGAGLGLSAVQGFVAQAGGALRIDSALTQGTTVRLYLPRSHQLDAIASPQGTLSHSHREALSYGNGEMILIVEDRDPLRQTLADMLRRLRYCVKEMSTGDEAIAYLETAPQVDLVLSDVVMPGQHSGFGVRDWVACHRPDLPVILATGYSSEELADTTLVGSTPLLRKPYSLHQLASLLHSLLPRTAASALS